MSAPSLAPAPASAPPQDRAAAEATKLSTARSTRSYGEPYMSLPASTEALSNNLVPDPTGRGSSVHVNPPRADGKLSPTYGPLYQGRENHPGSASHWDVHIYWKPNNLDEKTYARKLHEAVRREFPEFQVKRFWEVPVGPHPVPMFEFNIFNTEQLGAAFSYLVENRGPLSILIHPNTGHDLDDHTTRATWLGPKVELDLDCLR